MARNSLCTCAGEPNCAVCKTAYADVVAALPQHWRISYSLMKDGVRCFVCICVRAHKCTLSRAHVERTVQCSRCPPAAATSTSAATPATHTTGATKKRNRNVRSCKRNGKRARREIISAEQFDRLFGEAARAKMPYTQPPFYVRDTAAISHADRQAAVAMLRECRGRHGECLCLPVADRKKRGAITQHYRRMALIVHPDKAHDIEGAEDAFKILVNAQSALIAVATEP